LTIYGQKVYTNGQSYLQIVVILWFLSWYFTDLQEISMRMCGPQTSVFFKALQIGLNGRRGRIYCGKILIMHRERRNVYEYSLIPLEG